VIPFVVGLRPNHEIGFEQILPGTKNRGAIPRCARNDGKKQRRKAKTKNKAKAKQKPKPKKFVSERVAYFDETADSGLPEFGTPGG